MRPNSNTLVSRKHKDPDVCFACPDLSIDAAARPTSPARLRLDRSRPAEKNLAECVENAATVRIRDGTIEIVDGPFAETKEQLGGYYLLDCGDLDEALGYAARIPTATYGSIEVRPIMVFS